MKKILFILVLICLIFPVFPARARGLDGRLRGRILLQVEKAGEAWYVSPLDGERYFLGRPADAFSVMRSLGLGINNKDIEKIGLPSQTSTDDNLAKRLAGRIVLQVEANGEAWYIDPTDYKRYFLGRPNDAFALMRSKGLGITNGDLGEVEISKNSLSATRKPKVELFVMSLCPYGLQMQKGILPVAKLLGEKIDFEMKFVDYAMHGQTELFENLNQYCVQKIDKNKYLNYLECFMTEGDISSCLSSLEITASAIEECVKEADEKYSIMANYNNGEAYMSGRYPGFDINKEEVEKYGVSGSPTLVIDGKKVITARDPASLLETVCSYFDDQPLECLEELSSSTPSAGFGYVGSNASGACG